MAILVGYTRTGQLMRTGGAGEGGLQLCHALHVDTHRSVNSVDRPPCTLLDPREPSLRLSSSARLLGPRLLVCSYLAALRLPSAHSISATLIRHFLSPPPGWV